MKELVFGCLMTWAAIAEVNHGKPLTEDFICFQPAPMMSDFLSQHPGWNNILHERGEGAIEFYIWFNNIPPTSRIVADEVIVFSHPDKDFYWIWVLHNGGWLNIFKMRPTIVDVWIKKREREKASK